jgi:hypothetical protein
VSQIGVWATKPARSKRASTDTPFESLALELRRVNEQPQDMEDLMELRSATERNAGNPGIPWDEVRAEVTAEL